MFEWIIKSENVTKIKIRFFTIYSILGIVVLSIYAVLNYSLERYDLVLINLSMVISFFLLTVHSVKNNTEKYSSTIGIIPVSLLALSNFAIGGYFGVSIYWTFIFPIIVFYLSSASLALVANLAYLFLTFILFLAGKFGEFNFLYSDIEYLNYFLSIGAVSLLSLIFNVTWKFSSDFINTQKKKLAEVNKELKERVEELEDLKIKLEESNDEMKKNMDETDKLNKSLVNRELKMIKLKDKITSLEENIP